MGGWMGGAPLLPRSAPNPGVLVLSEMRAERAGVQVEISLKMFLLQRQKHFASRRLFPAIISAAFNCFASEINRIRKIASLFLRAPFFTPLLCAGCRLWLLLSRSCKQTRPRSRL